MSFWDFRSAMPHRCLIFFCYWGYLYRCLYSPITVKCKISDNLSKEILFWDFTVIFYHNQIATNVQRRENNTVYQKTESAKLRALHVRVSACLACLCAQVVTSLTCLRVHVPTCLACSRANVPYVLTYRK